MSSLAVLNCMRSKQIYPCGPREMYWPSILFRSQVAFVEARYDNWVVVSSKYGVVQQDQIIEPYDAFVGSSGLVVKETTKKYTAAEKRARGNRVSQEIEMLGYDQVDYFISNSYANLFPRNVSGSARDLRDLYGHDESNLKNVAIGKTKSSYGWRLDEE